MQIYHTSGSEMLKKHTDVLREGWGNMWTAFFFKRKWRVRTFTAVCKLYRRERGYSCTWGRLGRPPCHKAQYQKCDLIKTDQDSRPSRSLCSAFGNVSPIKMTEVLEGNKRDGGENKHNEHCCCPDLRGCFKSRLDGEKRNEETRKETEKAKDSHKSE